MKPSPLDWKRFDAVSGALAAQGFNVIPLPPCAKGAQGSGVGFRKFNKPGAARTSKADRRYWAQAFEKRGFEGTVNAYLLTASGIDFCFAVVDLDDARFEARAVEVFGETPLFVSRSGRRRHLYYRVKPSDVRRAHLLRAWGPRSVDIITSTGVVAPGSIHKDGEAYTLSIPLEQWSEDWTRENVPFLNVDAVEKLRREKHGAREGEAIKPKPVEGKAEGFVHLRRPVVLSTGSQLSGHVFPSTIIETIDGPRPLCEIEPGTRCFATYRDDATPSASVSRSKGRTYFWDHSRGMFWEMTEPRRADEDPELEVGANYFASLERALEDLGIEVEILEDVGFLGDQVGLLEEGETVFLIAPHGAGKTVLAKREHARADTSISVCNTQALTIANAAVLGLRPVYEGIDETKPKGSVCIPSLRRYEEAPDFFHVDEADAVHSFLHSGIVDEPLEAWRHLADFAARSRRCLIASADLHFEDVALFAEAIRARNPKRRLRALVRVPTRARVTLRVRHVSAVKEALHDTLTRDRDAPVFVGISTRKLAGQIAQGYRAATAGPTIDLDEVATIADVVDTPRPLPLQGVRDDLVERGAPEAKAERAFFVSGENNRYSEAVRWLQDTRALVEAHDLIVTSPAVQSGVSLDLPVDSVFILHENRGLPADSIAQIARRARHPKSGEVVVGVPRWRPEQRRTDRPYLDALIERQAKTTIGAIRSSFPVFGKDHETTQDPEFLWSWRIRTRKLLRAYADPIGELLAAARRHGWRVSLELEDEGEPSAFNSITAAARSERERINAETTASAPEIDEGERRRLEAAAILETGERQKLDRATISDFYGLPVTPALVRLDGGGRYRAKVRAYTHAKLFATGFSDVLAYLDHTRGRGRQNTERSHTLARAALLASFVEALGGFDDLTFGVQDVRPIVRRYWRANRARFVTFFPDLKGPAREHEAKWACLRLRSLGARITTKGSSEARRKIVDFSIVDEHAEAYADRLFDLYQQAEAEAWRSNWKNKIA